MIKGYRFRLDENIRIVELPWFQQPWNFSVDVIYQLVCQWDAYFITHGS
jgi:hypothetical protein